MSYFLASNPQVLTSRSIHMPHSLKGMIGKASDPAKQEERHARSHSVHDHFNTTCIPVHPHQEGENLRDSILMQHTREQDRDRPPYHNLHRLQHRRNDVTFCIPQPPMYDRQHEKDSKAEDRRHHPACYDHPHHHKINHNKHEQPGLREGVFEYLVPDEVVSRSVRNAKERKRDNKGSKESSCWSHVLRNLFILHCSLSEFHHNCHPRKAQ
mmetsp:Transcript_23584/g.76833  ORF Transcript_23584/g.76833 Transcript_23584/m.76833 type:complete len:211 (+) Transcript_23584:454-1086(+)